MDEADVGRFLDLAYGASVEPGAWPKVVEALAGMIGGQGGALVWQDQATRQGHGVILGHDPGVLDDYFAAFSRAHPSQRWMAAPRARVRHFVPHIVADDEALPKAELMRTAFYNEFMAPHDMHSILRFGLAAEGDEAAFLIVSRPQRRDRFSDGDMGLARSLHAHLIRAFSVSRRVAEAMPAGGELLRLSPGALFVVDADARVLDASPAGEAMLRAQTGLVRSAGRLAAPTGEASGRLQAMIGRAAAADRGIRVGGSMTLARPDHTLPLAVTVIPLGAGEGPVMRPTPVALVSVVDPTLGAPASETRLREVLGLTGAEAKVAGLLFEGATPKEAADRLSVSFFTVRTHLARMFEKTGVSRQADLVRIIGRLDSLWRED